MTRVRAQQMYVPLNGLPVVFESQPPTPDYGSWYWKYVALAATSFFLLGLAVIWQISKMRVVREKWGGRRGPTPIRIK